MTVQLIAHGLINYNGKFLVIKRSKIKRGQPNFYPKYWDIPGGTVEKNELPQTACLREIQEETGLAATLKKILHEDSNFDESKQKVFTRLVYKTEIEQVTEIVLDKEEHSEYRWISSLNELQGEKIVPYLFDIMD